MATSRSAAGSDLLLFPELFTLELFTVADSWRDDPVSALPRVGEYIAEYRELFSAEARARNQFIAAGTHLEYREDGYYNIAYLFGPDGEHFEHRKTHIFPAEAGWSTLEGDEMTVAELPFATVGFCLLRDRDPRVRERADRTGRGNHSVPVVHLHRVRLLAGPALRTGTHGDREPDLLRALRNRWGDERKQEREHGPVEVARG